MYYISPPQLDQFNGIIFLNEIFLCSNQCFHLLYNFKNCSIQLRPSNCQQYVSVGCNERFEEIETWIFSSKFLLKFHKNPPTDLKSRQVFYLLGKPALPCLNNFFIFLFYLGKWIEKMFRLSCGIQFADRKINNTIRNTNIDFGYSCVRYHLSVDYFIITCIKHDKIKVDANFVHVYWCILTSHSAVFNDNRKQK